MSDDDFGWSSEDDAHVLAAIATNGQPDAKRKLKESTTTAAVPAKRSKSKKDTTPAPSPSTLLANSILKERFGINGFRLDQEKAITRLLDGGSAVVVFPTGGGKSLCYQVSLIFHNN